MDPKLKQLILSKHSLNEKDIISICVVRGYIKENLTQNKYQYAAFNRFVSFGVLKRGDLLISYSRFNYSTMEDEILDSWIINKKDIHLHKLRLYFHNIELLIVTDEYEFRIRASFIDIFLLRVIYKIGWLPKFKIGVNT